MRDLALLSVLVVVAAWTLFHPWIGAIAWTVVSLANPHRFTWGIAYDFPVAMVIAVVTLLGLALTRDRVRLPLQPPVILLGLLASWFCVTLPFSINPIEQNYDMWNKVMKIDFMTMVIMVVLHTRRQIDVFVWAIVGALGWYGVKGGIFTALTGGGHRVWGPSDSFVSGNNEIALALITMAPLIWYLRQVAANRWIRHGLVAAMALCILAALGSQSRGALVGTVAMVAMLWWKSPNKVGTGMLLVLLIPLIALFLPDSWWERMATIQTYDTDGSAQGRINAWRMAWNLAVDRPFGGGFQIYDIGVFSLYAPNPTDVHAAHSIYFQVLGEHGFVGLILFVALWWSVWRTAGWLRRNCGADKETMWCRNLGAMCQVCLVGYGVGGAFLSLAYFDLPYYVLAVVVLAKRWAQDRSTVGSASAGKGNAQLASRIGGALSPEART